MTSAFDTAFMRQLHARLDEEMHQRETALLDGTIRNHEDYKHLTGIRKGLMTAKEIALKVEQDLIAPPGHVKLKAKEYGT